MKSENGKETRSGKHKERWKLLSEFHVISDKIVRIAVGLCFIVISCSGCGIVKIIEDDVINYTPYDTLPEPEKIRLIEPEDMFEIPIIIKNNTGEEICEIYASKVDSESWGDDLLQNDTLKISESILVNLEMTINTLKWDFLIVNEDGENSNFYNIDFSRYDESGVIFIFNADDTVTIEKRERSSFSDSISN